MGSRRDPFFLVAAILVHAAGIWGARAALRFTSQPSDEAWLDAHRTPRELAEAGASETNPIEIEVLPDEPTSPPGSATDAQVGIAAALRSPAARLGYMESKPGERRPAQAPSEAGSNVEPAPTESVAAPEAGWLPNEENGPGRAPGLNGAPVWAIPGVLPAPSAVGTKPLAPRVSRAGQAASPGVNPSEAQKQTALFPGAGTLASAVSEEVSSSSAPAVSESRFKLTVDANGRLVSAVFLSANGGERSVWEGIARAVHRRFAGKSMPLPASFAGGSAVYVSISSRVTMPDGTTHGTPSPRSLLEKAPDNEYGRIESPLNDRFRSPMTSTAPVPNKITGGLPFVMDLSNIGATRRRVVRASVQAVPLTASAAP